jgi:hypothetical protein
MNLLLGSQKASDEYFASSKAAAGTLGDSAVDKLMKELEGILGNSGASADTVTNAEKVWREWLAKEIDDHSKEGLKEVYTLSSDTARRLLALIFGIALVEEGTDDLKSIKRTGPYPSAIVKDLVENRWVTNDSYPGGLIESGLIPANDWVSHRVFDPEVG